jgi:hypothetical protein
MREAGLDLDAAGPTRSGLPYDRHELVAEPDHSLRLDPKALKALDPAPEEALEAVAATMRARLGTPTGLVPLNVWIEQVEHNRDVTAIQGGIPTLECLDVRLSHAGQYIRLACCSMMST